MKTANVPLKSLIIGAGALAFAAGVATAQTAFTKPVGYHTETITAGAFNVIGANLVNGAEVSSSLTGAAGTTLSDSATDFSALQGSFSIEFDNGAWAEITGFNGNDITTATDISGSVAAGDSYVIRSMKTISQIFGGSSADDPAVFATADTVVWIPSGPGAFEKYFFNVGGADPFSDADTWIRVSDNAASNDAPIPFTKGILVESKEAANVDLVITGHVKTTSTIVNLADEAFSYVSRIYPSGSTLGNWATAGVTEGDTIWAPNNDAGFTSSKFFWNQGLDPFAPNGWVSLADNSEAGDVAAPSAVIYEHAGGGARSLTISAPDFYSNL